MCIGLRRVNAQENKRVSAGRDKCWLARQKMSGYDTWKLTISVTMRVLRLKCSSCISTLRKVEVPTWARRHIIKKHYPKRKHGGQSTFFKKSMSPQRLFDTSLEIRQFCQTLRRNILFFSYYILNFLVEFFLHMRITCQIIHQPQKRSCGLHYWKGEKIIKWSVENVDTWCEGWLITGRDRWRNKFLFSALLVFFLFSLIAT